MQTFRYEKYLRKCEFPRIEEFFFNDIISILLTDIN